MVKENMQPQSLAKLKDVRENTNSDVGNPHHFDLFRLNATGSHKGLVSDNVSKKKCPSEPVEIKELPSMKEIEDFAKEKIELTKEVNNCIKHAKENEREFAKDKQKYKKYLKYIEALDPLKEAKNAEDLKKIRTLIGASELQKTSSENKPEITVTESKDSPIQDGGSSSNWLKTAWHTFLADLKSVTSQDELYYDDSGLPVPKPLSGLAKDKEKTSPNPSSIDVSNPSEETSHGSLRHRNVNSDRETDSAIKPSH